VTPIAASFELKDIRSKPSTEVDVTSDCVRVTGITIAVSFGVSTATTSAPATISNSDKEPMNAEGNNGGAGWCRRLDKPVELPDGMTLATLAEAGAYILGLPNKIKQRASWQRATDLLLKAASGEASVEDARTQIEHALLMDLTLLLSDQSA
jgi:hypothetical protein